MNKKQLRQTLRAYLLECELAPDEEEDNEMLEDYSTADGIVFEFECGLNIIEGISLIQAQVCKG